MTTTRIQSEVTSVNEYCHPHLVIDIREHELIKCLQSQNVTFTVSTMPVGDILITSASRKSMLLFERKTLSDLVASLKDGRLYEQLQRRRAWSLNSDDSNDNNQEISSLHQHRRRFVILEGIEAPNVFSGSNELGDIDGISLKTIQSILLDLVTLRDESILITTSPNSTAILISRLLSRFSENQNLEIQSDMPYKPATQTSSIKLQRRANLDECTTILCMHLSAIPGVSFAKARQIATHLKVNSIREFIKVVLEDPDSCDGKQSKLLLVAGIGKTLAIRIHRLFGY